MKLAVTADVHLLAKQDFPERWNTLRNILEDISKREINGIIIARDLFDKDYRNYADFDNLASEYADTGFYIIPGNHDSSINQKAFASNNVTVYSETQIIDFTDSSIPFLFVPYRPGISMGEEIASHLDMFSPSKWILVSHGDWAESEVGVGSNFWFALLLKTAGLKSKGVPTEIGSE